MSEEVQVTTIMHNAKPWIDKVLDRYLILSGQSQAYLQGITHIWSQVG